MTWDKIVKVSQFINDESLQFAFGFCFFESLLLRQITKKAKETCIDFRLMQTLLSKLFRGLNIDRTMYFRSIILGPFSLNFSGFVAFSFKQL